MRRVTLFLTVLLIGAMTASGETPPFESESVTPERIRAQIMSIEEMPCGEPYGEGDPRYWELVRLGLEHVPELLEVVDDPTATQVSVCLVGGEYAVGDIALFAAMNIVRIPVVSLFPSLDSQEVERIGFGVYWKHVRESPQNRLQLEDQLLRWFSEHQDKLAWKRLSEHPSGGYYVLPEPDDG